MRATCGASRALTSTLALAALLGCPATAAAPPSPNVAKFYQLSEGVCLNGDKASVYAYHEPADKGLSNDWVVQLGGPPELNWCIDPAHCAIFAKPPAPGSTCSTNASLCPLNVTLLGFGGPLSTNCTDNPDFCKANMATIEPSCTMDLFMGNATLWSNTTNETVHFDGLSVLKSSIAKLGELGLSQAGARILWISIEMAVFCNIKQYEKAAIATQFAVDTRNSTTDDHRFWGNLGLTFSWSSTERVLFTGVAHAGTMVYLHADRVHAQIRAMSPALKTFKALPVDGLHPKFPTLIYAGNDLTGPRPDSWLTPALETLGGMVFGADGGEGAVLEGCRKAQLPNETWKCLYVNESLPYINSSLFAVNQMLSVWDSQCQIEGIPAPNSILQVHCSLKGPGWATARQCNQYPEYCPPSYIAIVTAPYQRQSGAQVKQGNGGFFHSCYLGSYFQSGWGGTAIWNIIKIGDLTMREAISNWWHDGEAPPPVRCNTKIEHCPGGSVCPASGVCPTYTHADKAAWTTDCVWDHNQPEPPPWTNMTCEDWKYNANQTGKPGCYGKHSCCPPEDGSCKYFSCTPRPPWGNKWNCNPSCGEIQVYY